MHIAVRTHVGEYGALSGLVEFQVGVCVLQDLTKDVFRIDAIPSQSLDTVREWLSSMDIKFYENKVNLNWKQVLKSIVDVSTSPSASDIAA